MESRTTNNTTRGLPTSQTMSTFDPDNDKKTLFCLDCYNYKSELLEYDYNYDDASKPPQPYPRIRERGEYYIDTYNDQPWGCTFGTHENVSHSPHPYNGT